MSASLFYWFFLTCKWLIIIKEMTQVLNKALKMLSLLKVFNQILLAVYGNVLAWFEIPAFKKNYQLAPFLATQKTYKKKIVGETSISRDIWDHLEVFYASMESEEQQFSCMCYFIGQGKKVSHRRNLNSSHNPLLFSC